MGPAQLPTKVRAPTAATSKAATPLYALARSTEAIELEPPAAKKAACCRSRAVTVNEAGEEESTLSLSLVSSSSSSSSLLLLSSWAVAVGGEGEDGEMRDSRSRCCRLKSRKSGALVGRDWVRARRV
jgi:hypothetical protein